MRGDRANSNIPRIIRAVRERLGVSQEGLSRRLNATKGAIQHWERGRNHPDLARLMALRDLCPPGAERRQLEKLIKLQQSQATVSPEADAGAPQATNMLQRENGRLRKQIERLEVTLD